MIEILLEDILTKIHTKNYSEPKQISDELRRLVLVDKLSLKQISYCSAKLFNSELNLFVFLNENAQVKEKRVGNLKKELLVIMSDYIKLYSPNLINYLETLRNSLLRHFKLELTQEAKESSLFVLLTMIELYEPDLLGPVLQVKTMAQIFLDEIQRMKPKAGVKGALWTILGILSKKFTDEMSQFRVEIEELMLYTMKKMMKENKGVELKTLEGILKSFRYMLSDHQLEEEELQEVYVSASCGIKIIDDVKNFKIVKQSLLLLKEHWELFSKYIDKNESYLIDSLLELIRHRNRKIKESACDCFESLITFLAKRHDSQAHRDFVKNFIKQAKSIIRTSADPVEIMVCIRCYGILSKSISQYFGQDELRKHFMLLMEISETKVIRRIEDTFEEELEVKPENFKKLLYRQKQLNSHIIAFAHVIKEVAILQEKEAKHVLKLFLLGVKAHSEIFEGYKKYLYKALVVMINSLSKHEKIFKFWLKKVIQESIVNLIDLGPSALDSEASERWALHRSSNLLKRMLTHDEWIPEVQKDFKKELILGIINYFENSKLGYDEVTEIGTKMFIPESHIDQHLTNRVAIIFNEVQSQGLLDDELETSFRDLLAPIFKEIMKYPRTCSLQKMMKSLFEISERLEFKILSGNSELSEIFEKIYENNFQNLRDLKNEILLDCIKVLLACPCYILNKNQKFVEFLKRVVITALEIAKSENVHLVYNIIECLEKLLIRGRIDLKRGRADFLEEVLPYFSSLLARQDNEISLDSYFNESYEESMRSKEQILGKIIQFLGALGSEAHYISKNKHQDEEIDDNEGEELFINLPLNRTQLKMNLTKLIKRSSELACDSLHPEVQAAACELLHASTILLIGKCAQGNNPSEDFSVALESALPSIIKLATNERDFSGLFGDLVLQISRWLSHNKEEENNLVSSFLVVLLELAGRNDKSEQRSICLDAIREFLSYSLHIHQKPETCVKNFALFLRKVELLSLHPDPLRKLVGLMCIQEVVSQLATEPKLLKCLFFDVCYFFFVLLRSSGKDIDESSSTIDSSLCAEAIYSKLEFIIREHSNLFIYHQDEQSRFINFENLANYLQKNIFSPETSLRTYSLRMWTLLVGEKRELLNTEYLSTQFTFLEDVFGDEDDDLEYGLKNFTAHSSAFSLLLESNYMKASHLMSSIKFASYKVNALKLLKFNTNDDSRKIFKLRNEGLLQFLRLLGLLQKDHKEIALEGINIRDVSGMLMRNTFKSATDYNIKLCKRCLQIFEFDLVEYVKEFIEAHEYNFLGRNSNIFEFNYTVNLSSVEAFFDAILKLLSPERIRQELFTNEIANFFFSFIKNCTKKVMSNTVGRAKIFLNALLSVDCIGSKDALIFFDPFRREAEHFGSIVNKYLSEKVKGNKWAPVAIELIESSRIDGHIFPSLAGFIELLIESKRDLSPIIETMVYQFDALLLEIDNPHLKDILRIARMVFKHANIYPQDFSIRLCKTGLKRDTIAELGVASIEFATEFLSFYKESDFSRLYAELKFSLQQYSADVVPIELDEQAKAVQTIDDINTSVFINKIIDLMRSCNSIEPIEIIFAVILSKNRFRRNLLDCIEEIAKALDSSQKFLHQTSHLLSIFQNPEVCSNLKRNIRFNLVDRCLLPLLDNSPENHLVEFFKKFYLHLIKVFDHGPFSDPKQKLLHVMEISSFYKIVETLYRNISQERIRGEVHVAVVGDKTSGNELTKKLILLSHQSKATPHSYLNEVRASFEYKDDETWVLAKEIFIEHARTAYCCLGSVILKTQKKIPIFLKFLMEKNESKGELLFENLIEEGFKFQFSVETNFSVAFLDQYYKASPNENLEDKKKNASSFLSKIADDSLFTQSIARGRIIQGAFNSNNLIRDISSSQGEKMDEESFTQTEVIGDEKDDSILLELDRLNSLGPMRTIIRVFDKIKKLELGSMKIEGIDELPPWAAKFYEILSSNKYIKEIKIYILKVILNRQSMFKPYRLYFNRYLLEYLTLEDNGGEGFHYFMRDVCMTLCLWNSEQGSINIEGSGQDLRKLAFNACRQISKRIGDRSRQVFILNIEIFQSIVSLLRESIVFDKDLIYKMLLFKPANKDISVEEADDSIAQNEWIIWRLAGISIIEISLIERIEICTLDDLLNNPNKKSSCPPNTLTLTATISFDDQIGNEEQTDQIIIPDDIIKALAFNLRKENLRIKIPVCRALGNYLFSLDKYDPESMNVAEALSKTLMTELRSLNTKQQNAFPLCLAEVISTSPELSTELEVLGWISGVIINQIESRRASIWKALQFVFKKALEDQNKYDYCICEITQHIRASINKILRDTDANNIHEFLCLLVHISRLNHNSVVQMLESNLSDIGESLRVSIRAEDENIFFDWVEIMYDNFKDNKKIRLECTKHVLLGLSSENPEIRKRFIDFLNSEDRLPSSESKRVNFILKELYSSGSEHNWLTTSANIMLSLSQKSPQASTQIFPGGLHGYQSTGVLQIGKNKRIKSAFTQPMIPLSLIYGSQTLQFDKKMSQSIFNRFSQFDTGLDLPTQSDPAQREIMMKTRMKFAYGVNDSQNEEINSVEPSQFGRSESGYSKYTIRSAADTIGKTAQVKRLMSKASNRVRSFFKTNRFNWNQVSQLDDNRVRIQKSYKVGTKFDDQFKVPGQLIIQNEGLPTIREYRKGELPDIEISYRDIILPLVIVSSKDAKLAQEILVSIFVEVYKLLDINEKRQNLKYLLNIIRSSKKDFQVINTIQSIIYNLSLSADDISIDPELITKTGTGSLSYGGAALLIEEILAKTLRSEVSELDLSKPSKMIRDNSGNIIPLERNTENDKFYLTITKNSSRSLVLNLIELYKNMNEEDNLRGLYRTLHSTNPNAISILDMKLGKNTALCIKSFDTLLQESEEEGESYLEYLRSERRQAMFELNKWADIISDVKTDPNFVTSLRKVDEYANPIIGSFDCFTQNDRYNYLRSMLVSTEHSDELATSIELISDELEGKTILEEEHPYEMALLSVQMLEFDRAKFYLEKFRDKFLKNWRSIRDFSGSVLKNEVISDILKQQELESFLACTTHYHIKDYPAIEDINQFFDTAGDWLRKSSAGSSDTFGYLSDIYHSRVLFFDTMHFRHEQSYKEEDYQRHHIKASLCYAKNLLKMGYLDTCDKVLVKAFRKKQTVFSESEPLLDFEFAELLVKSKLSGVVRDIEFLSRVVDESTLTLGFLVKKFSKVKKMLDYCLEKKEGASQTLQLNYSFLELKTRVEKLQRIRDYFGPEKVGDDSTMFIDEALAIIDDMNDNIVQVEEYCSYQDLIIHGDISEYHAMKKKMVVEGAGMAETVLRWFKEKANNTKKPLSEFGAEVSIGMISNQLIRWVADLVSLGNFDQAKIILILDLVFELGGDTAIAFTECFNKIPSWIFLKWLPQLMSYMNSKSYKAFYPVIERMAKEYPEPCFYQISTSIDDLIWKEGSIGEGVSALKLLYTNLYSEFTTHKSFIRALECMVHPEQRLGLWLDEMIQYSKDKERLEQLKNSLISDVFVEQDNLVGHELGDFNKKFSRDVKPYISKYFGINFCNLLEMDPDSIEKSCKEFKSKAEKYVLVNSMGTSGTYKAKLSKHSEWLAQYDINSLRKESLRLEVPGQYIGNRAPITSLHIRVSYFIPETLVLASIRKPKRLSIFGTDEKVHHILVKGGEDLRLDERIQQIYSLMNDIFKVDVECAQRDYNIGTFRVIPVKKHLGVMQWIKNTIPLKIIIEKELPEGYTLMENRAIAKRMDYMLKASKGNRDVKVMHLSLLKIQRESLVKEFTEQLKHFPSNLLKNSIRKKASNAEQYIRLRGKILTNYALLSLSSYILGVGDRHLDNFLFDSKSGKIIPIDFGYSFGFGVGLPVPELMPFRLTQNFVELAYPLGISGSFRSTMIYSLRALKYNRHILIDTCEVFVRDPLIDWLKMSRKKSISISETAGGTSQILSATTWFPQEKIKIVRAKLRGESPVSIMLQELNMSIHSKQSYFGNIQCIVRGEEPRYRQHFPEGVLPLADQVDCLIDMATDPDILGRTWTGWNPFV